MKQKRNSFKTVSFQFHFVERTVSAATGRCPYVNGCSPALIPLQNAEILLAVSAGSKTPSGSNSVCRASQQSVQVTVDSYISSRCCRRVNAQLRSFNADIIWPVNDRADATKPRHASRSHALFNITDRSTTTTSSLIESRRRPPRLYPFSAATAAAASVIVQLAVQFRSLTTVISMHTPRVAPDWHIMSPSRFLTECGNHGSYLCLGSSNCSGSLYFTSAAYFLSNDWLSTPSPK